MTEPKPEWELTGLERFNHLEDKLYRVVEAFKAIRKENDSLRTENQKLKGELQIIQERHNTTNGNLAELQKEREDLRERVEKALGLLATLELQ